MLNSQCGPIVRPLIGGKLRAVMRRVFKRQVSACVPGLIFCVFVSASWAQESGKDSVIGFVKTVRAEASVVIGGTPVKAQPGMAIQPGHVLKTGAGGSMGVTFKDNTVMSLGADTELVVDEYLYAPGKGDLKLAATLTRGTLQYISGIIAKLKPDAVNVKTPVGIIGVRGTRYLALVDEKNP
jgi:FecR protein